MVAAKELGLPLTLTQLRGPYVAVWAREGNLQRGLGRNGPSGWSIKVEGATSESICIERTLSKPPDPDYGLGRHSGSKSQMAMTDYTPHGVPTHQIMV